MFSQLIDALGDSSLWVGPTPGRCLVGDPM